MLFKRSVPERQDQSVLTGQGFAEELGGVLPLEDCLGRGVLEVGCGFRARDDGHVEAGVHKGFEDLTTEVSASLDSDNEKVTSSFQKRG